MVRTDAVRVSQERAEQVRRLLAEEGLLRRDVAVGREGQEVLFPVAGCPAGFRTEVVDLPARAGRPRSYVELLPGPARELAPRAFEQLGDIVVVKVPDEAAEHRAAIGAALARFTKARAVFHDGGVQDPWRTRALERIAGTGPSETTVLENGVRLHVDPAAAYYSPRLATERARVAGMVAAGQHVIDLFGGVAPFGVQAALKGAYVESVDINPAACALARINVAENGLQEQVRIHEGDARRVAAMLRPADRLVMNLPHGAHAFLDLVPGLLKEGGVLHYHEMVPPDEVAARGRALASLRPGAQLRSVRTVRTYSPQEDHVAFDVRF